VKKGCTTNFILLWACERTFFLHPWLQPGEQKRPKTKRFQPLKGLNAKATKNAEKENHRASHWDPFGKSAGEKRMIDLNRAVKRGVYHMIKKINK
jgi:hypothetical protein